MSAADHGMKHRDAHARNFEALFGRGVATPEDRQAASWWWHLRGDDGGSEDPALAAVDPKNLLQLDRLSPEPELLAQQIQNCVFALSYMLAPKEQIEGRRLVLPGGYLVGSRCVDDPDSRPWPPAPGPLGLKGDGADGARALLSIARYAIKLLGTWGEDSLRTVAEQTSQWPILADERTKLEEFQQWARRIHLGAVSPVDLRGKGISVPRNRVVLHELREIHQYLIDPIAFNTDLDYFVVDDPESGELVMRERPTAWQRLADRLPPLARPNWEEWWRVIWSKLNEERAEGYVECSSNYSRRKLASTSNTGEVHLRPKFRSLPDLSDIGLPGAQACVRARLERAGLKDEARAIAERLESRFGIWIGATAEEIGIAGQPFDSDERKAAKNLIQKTLKAALRTLVADNWGRGE